jgi:hypothetical protein
MPSWTSLTQYAIEVLAVALIFRLIKLRDRRIGVYSVFAVFLGVQLAGALAYFACRQWHQLDYRVVWFSFTATLAFFSLFLVYSLAKAVLSELPGILRFSRLFLNIVFPVAIIIAFSTAKAEHWMMPAGNFDQRLDRLIAIFKIADKGISLASVLILIAILGFILWFPVKMSRNLAVFSVGFVIYFASKTGLELLSLYNAASLKTQDIIGLGVNIVLVSCFVYWVLFIDANGQAIEVRIGHGWHRDEQEKLIGQLEALNVALLRSSQQLSSSQHLPL